MLHKHVLDTKCVMLMNLISRKLIIIGFSNKDSFKITVKYGYYSKKIHEYLFHHFLLKLFLNSIFHTFKVDTKIINFS